MLKDTGYVFSGKYKPRKYKPDYIDGLKYYKYLIATLIFFGSIWGLLAILGGVI